MKNGKPLPGPANIPAEKGKIHLTVEDFRATTRDGEDLYMLSGWVYAEGLPDSGGYRKKLVLHSVKGDLVFPAETVERKDLTSVFSDLNINLDHAGFRVYFAKNLLKIDNYRVGMILEDDQGNVQAYRLEDKYIQREPNRMRYVGH